MNHFIFNKERMDFRYSSGTVMYSEKLLDGRLMSMNYNAQGMPVALEGALTSKMFLVETK